MDLLPTLFQHFSADALTGSVAAVQGLAHHAIVFAGHSVDHADHAAHAAHAAVELLASVSGHADALSHIASSPPTSVTDSTLAADAAANAAAAVPPDSWSATAESFAKYLKYGPWAVLIIFILSGVGLHLSEDLILIPAGILIARGEHLPMWETLIAAYVGLVIGDLLWIFLCRRYGTKMIQSRWFKRVVHPRRLLEAKHQMEERGIVVVILARFIPGTRTPVITMAGILHMAWWKLILVELTTCAVTVPLQMGVGYLIGKGVGEAKSMGELIIKLLAALAALVAVGFIIHWWVQSKKRKGRAPRSKASWLRKFGRRRRAGESPELSHPA